MNQLFVTVLLLLSTAVLQSQSLKPLKDKESGRYGYVDKHDNFIIKPKYDKAKKFDGGLAEVEVGDLAGLIDATGDYIVLPKYDKISSFNDGFAQVKLHGFYGLINKQGGIIIRPKYDDIDSFNDGVAVVTLNKQEGLVNIEGTQITAPRYSHIGSFADGTAVVEVRNKQGILSIEGHELLKPSFDKINKFKKGYSIVEDKDKLGLINNGGEVLLSALYDDIEVESSLVYVYANSRYGLCDINGITIFEPQFIEQPTFDIDKSYAIVQKTDKVDGVIKPLYGLITKHGEFSLPCHSLELFKDKDFYFAQSSMNSKWEIYDGAFNQLNCDIDTLVKFNKHYFSDDLCAVKKLGKWGFINNFGEEVVACQYDEIHSEGFEAGFCAVKIDGLWGIVKLDGSYLFEPQFTKIETAFSGLGTKKSAEVWDNYKMYQIFHDASRLLLKDITPDSEG